VREVLCKIVVEEGCEDCGRGLGAEEEVAFSRGNVVF